MTLWIIPTLSHAVGTGKHMESLAMRLVPRLAGVARAYSTPVSEDRMLLREALRYGLELKNSQKGLPKAVTIRHVGPRDGLQGMRVTMPVKARKSLVQELVAAGFNHVEVGSLGVRNLTSMWDSDRLKDMLEPSKGVTYTHLTMREKIFKRALKSWGGNHHQAAVVFGMTDTFNENNVGVPSEILFSEIGAIAREAKVEGVALTGYVSLAFGSVEPWQVARITRNMMEVGIKTIIPSDTNGVATPESMRELMKAMRAFKLDPSLLSIHLHRTKEPFGELSNLLTFLNEGGRMVDVGYHDESLGGCPYSGSPRSGNLSDMLTVRLLHELGIKTGIDPLSLAMANVGQRHLVAQLRQSETIIDVKPIENPPA